jgi:RNA polymerase sigma-70 factor (ECF subfamily)
MVFPLLAAVQASPPDATLVDAARAGDESAFEHLYRRFYARIYALALRMTRDFRDAEEASQEVFLAAWRALGTFRGESAFATWLHTIALRTFAARSRKHLRRAETSIDDHEDRLRVELPDTSIDIERAIGGLPEGARAIVLMHDLHGYKCREIAAMLGIAVGTVKSQLHRGRGILIKKMGETRHASR